MMAPIRQRSWSIFGVFCFILTCWVDRTWCTSIADVNNVSSTLLSGYNKYTRPVSDQSTVVNVNAYLSLIAIRDFDEVAGKLSTGILFNFNWMDASFVWDPNSYNGASKVTFSQNDVWKPELLLANPHSDLEQLGHWLYVTVTVHEDGSVSWSPLSMMDTTCGLDTKYYPFDSQTCKLEMFVQGVDDSEVLINVTSSTLDLRYYEGNSLWEITTTSVANVGGKVENLSFLTVIITLKRQPTFIVVSFLVPILTLAFLNPLVFVLPTDSGERIGFSITILLSLSVFMTILGDYIPPNASPMSLSAFMLMVLYLCSSFILLLVILSVRVYFVSEKNPVGSFSKALVKISALEFCKSTKIHTKDENENIKNKQTSKIQVKPKKENDQIEHGEDDRTGDSVSWHDVSRAIDKLCFVGMYVIISIASAVFIGVLNREGS